MAKVSATRKTPDNASHGRVVLQLAGGVSCVFLGQEIAFPAWALALIVMYVLANIGVVRYYAFERRSGV